MLLKHFTDVDLSDKKAIKERYRKLSFKYHPDITKDNASTFQEILDEYEAIIKGDLKEEELILGDLPHREGNSVWSAKNVYVTIDVPIQQLIEGYTVYMEYERRKFTKRKDYSMITRVDLKIRSWLLNKKCQIVCKGLGNTNTYEKADLVVKIRLEDKYYIDFTHKPVPLLHMRIEGNSTILPSGELRSFSPNELSDELLLKKQGLVFKTNKGLVRGDLKLFRAK